MRYIRKHTEGNYSRRIFCMLLCLCMVFSQMSFAFAGDEGVSADSGADIGTQEEQSIDMSTAFVYTQAEGGGTGSWGWATDYESYKVFTIASDNDWNAFAQCVNAGNTLSGVTVKLAKDVDITRAAQQMITGTFSGTLDGQGYTLEGINISASIKASDYAGLFKQVIGGTIRDLEIKGLFVAQIDGYPVCMGGVGALVGHGVNCTIEKVKANEVKIVTSNLYQGNVGVLAGTVINGSTISNCMISCSLVTGTCQSYKSVAAAVQNGSKVTGCVSYINGVDIAAGDGTVENSFFLCNEATRNPKGTPKSMAELNSAKTAWLLSEGNANSPWGVDSKGNLVFNEHDMAKAVRIRIARTEKVTETDASFTVSCINEEVGGTTLVKESSDGRLILYGTGSLNVTVTIKNTTEGAAEKPQIIEQTAGQGAAITEKTDSEDPASLTYEIQPKGTDVEIIYGSQLDKDNLTTTEWYDDAQAEFTIRTFGELRYFADKVNAGTSFKGKTVTLEANITVPQGVVWTPIGADTNRPFEGIFDGDNHRISGINVNTSGMYAGLFGAINGATVKNLNLASGSVASTYSGSGAYVGGVAGYAESSTIENCTNSLEVKAIGCVGGIGGYLCKGSSIINCTNSGLVENKNTTTKSYIGGICGQLKYEANENADRILYSKNDGTIKDVSTNNAVIGGIVGYVGKDRVVKSCLNLGSVSGKYSGSIVGSNYGGITGCLSNVQSLKFAGEAGYTAKYIDNYTVYGDDNTDGIIYMTAAELKSPLLVVRLNEASENKNFWGYKGDENYEYPIFADNGKNPVYTIQICTLSGNPTVEEENCSGEEATDAGKTYSYYGSENLELSISADDLFFMVIRNGKCTRTKANATAKIRGKENDIANIVVYCGTEKQLDSVKVKEWYDSVQKEFEISTPGQLLGMAELVAEGNDFSGQTVTLANDIDLSAVCGSEKGSWQPIGTTAHPFKGTFDGDSKTISGLYINNTSGDEPQGLFGYTYDATVKNFAISGEITNSGAGNTGGVIGTAGGTVANDSGVVAGKIEITDIEANVTVRGAGTYTGGIVGYIDAYNKNKLSGAIVTACRLVNRGDCTYTGESETSYVGGVIGGLGYGDIGSNSSKFTKSVNNGAVTNEKGTAGGLIGSWINDCNYVTKTTKIENVYNTGSVTAKKAGGVVGAIQVTNENQGTAQLSLKRALNYGVITGSGESYGIAGSPSTGNCDTDKLYYLDGTPTGKASGAELGEKVSTDELKTGEIAFDLDNGASNNRSGVWGQSTANDRPEFYDASTAPLVYKMSVKTTGCNLTQSALTNLNILSTVKEGDIANRYVTATFGTTPFISWEAIGTTNEYVLNTVHIKNQKGEEIPATVNEENNTISFDVPLNTNLSAEIECIRVPNRGANMKLILHGNGGKIGEEEQTEIATVVGNRFNTLTELSGTAGFKNGKYEFTGWYLDEECTRAVDMSSRMVPEDRLPLTIDLYAGWDKTTPYYTVTLDANGGTFVADSIEETVEKSAVEAVDAPAAEPAAEPVEEPAAEPTVEPTVEPTIEIVNPVLDVKEGNPVDLAAYGADRVTREGFTFTGWFFDTEMHLHYSGEAISEDATLYAGWKATDSTQKLIDFDANGGYFTVNGQNSQRITHYYAYADNSSQVTLEDLNVPVVARDIKDGFGYTFAGWFTAKTPGVPETSWAESESVTENIELYANWTKKSFAEYIADQKAAQQGGETGETGSLSFVIKDIPTLNAFKAYVADCVSKGTSTAADSFALGADLTLDNRWTSGINGFEGTFDGNGHTLTYANAGASIFGTVKGTVENINVTGTATANGGIAKTLKGGTIYKCTVKSGSVLSGGNFAGGIVGEVYGVDGSSGTISNCQIESGVQITGGSYVGGIAGGATNNVGTVAISNCKIGSATIKGAGATSAQKDGSGDPVNDGSAVGGLGGILGYGKGEITDCMVEATIESNKVDGTTYGIGGIVGVQGTTQGAVQITRSGFIGTIKAENADSVGGVLGCNQNKDANRKAILQDVYSTCVLDISHAGNNIGGIVGSTPTGLYTDMSEGDTLVSIENAYWNGTVEKNIAGFDAISSNKLVTAQNAYYLNADGYESSQSGATGKPASAFLSGEVAYELDKNHNPRGTWTQGETGPIFNTEGDNGIIHKVEVDKTQEITWEDGTTATITTTISSDLSEKAGLTECNTVFVKNGAKVTTKVEGIPAAKVVKNSDGSTTTTNYNVQIKDKTGDQVIFDSANPTADIRINKDLAAGGTGGSSTATTGSGSGSGGGTGGGTGTGDQTGQGDGTGTGDGKGDGDQSGDGQGDGGHGSDGQGGQQGDGTGIIGDKGDKPHGGNGTGKDVTPSVVPKPNTATPAEKTVTQEVKNDPAPTQASEEVNHQQNDQPQSGGQSQGGGEQGQVQPESKIYKLIKSVTNTIKDNPVASAAIAIAIAGIVGAGALNRKRKEDFKKK